MSDSMKLLKSLFFIFCISFSGLVLAEDCELDQLLKTLKGKFTERYQKIEVNENAKAHAKKMKRLGLTDTSYMVEWQLKRKNQMGPWAMKGNTFVNGIKQTQGRKWMQEIGMKSFGLGFEQHPDNVYDTPTAVLRWKNQFFYFGNVQDDNIADLDFYLDPTREFMEATFMASESELKAIKDFIEARVRGEILAKKRIRSGSRVIEPGEEIRPEFEFTGENLFDESCANVCTSPFNPRWLEHYDSPQALKLASIALEKGIRPEVNAKALIFYNFRNTQASSITVLGLPKGLTGQKFIADNHWSETGGMMWGFIPDRPPAKPSPNYEDQRFTINEWLQRN